MTMYMDTQDFAAVIRNPPPETHSRCSQDPNPSFNFQLYPDLQTIPGIPTVKHQRDPLRVSWWVLAHSKLESD